MNKMPLLTVMNTTATVIPRVIPYSMGCFFVDMVLFYCGKHLDDHFYVSDATNNLDCEGWIEFCDWVDCVVGHQNKVVIFAISYDS